MAEWSVLVPHKFRFGLNYISFTYSIEKDYFKNLVPVLRTVQWNLLSLFKQNTGATMG